jgi:putative nucleotidyltransferase with HDIG domain
MDETLRKMLQDALTTEKSKEYACHVQYVAQIGIRLAREVGADVAVVEVACLLHDIGRDKELPGEDHAQTSERIARGLLEQSSFSDSQRELIFESILLHGSDTIPEKIEAQIVRSADAGSKVEFHEAFMLMCKKPTYEERLAWGMRYLEKGYEKISIESYKTRLRDKYDSISAMYKSTLAAIPHGN